MLLDVVVSNTNATTKLQIPPYKKKIQPIEQLVEDIIYDLKQLEVLHSFFV
jgi:hypothetical protein